MRSSLILVILLFGVGRSWASEKLPFETGNDFLDTCNPNKKPSKLTTKDQLTEAGYALYCSGYLLGFANGITAGQVLSRSGPAKLSVCFPHGASPGQFVKIAVKYMEDHPERLHEPAAALMLVSLMDAFPCPEGSPPQEK